MNKFEEIKLSSWFKKKVFEEYILPNYESTIQESLNLIKYFKRFGVAFETVSKFLVGVGSILSFSAGIYKNSTLSFVSGTVSVISLVFLQYSTFSIKESKKYTAELNNVLKKFNMETIPQPIQDFSDIFKNTPKKNQVEPGFQVNENFQADSGYRINNYRDEETTLTDSLHSDDFKDSNDGF